MTTMIAESRRGTALGVGFDASRARATSAEAWKQHIGSKPIPARLAVLPEQKPNWGRVGASAIFQISVLGFFLLIPLIYPVGMETAVRSYISIPMAQPLTEIPVAPPPPPPTKVETVAPKMEVKPAAIEPVKRNPQQPHIFANLTAPKPVQPKVEKMEAKAPAMTAVLDAVRIETKQSGPKRPREEVKVGNWASGSPAPPSFGTPLQEVQTGGFGDLNGAAGKGDANHATNVNRLGSPALPGGEGYGNGTGGKDAVRGTVASTGFGNSTAIPITTGDKKGSVVATGFASAADTTTDAPKKKTSSAGLADTPPDILDKPRPEYTAEGRSMKIEGDVVIDLVFLANGTVQIDRVVSGLGHGLDDTAVRAAQQISFKPAKRQGEPVNFPARVRIEFRLAY